MIIIITLITYIYYLNTKQYIINMAHQLEQDILYNININISFKMIYKYTKYKQRYYCPLYTYIT